MKLNIVLRLLENCKVPSTLKLTPATLKAFAGDVWQDMHPHPYHNFSHATDVAQSFYSILIATRLVKSLDPITVAASILAALCHDLDHPGYTNQYQENERTEFWLRPVCDCGDLRRPPRHRADTVMGTSSRRWRGPPRRRADAIRRGGARNTGCATRSRASRTTTTSASSGYSKYIT